ncbi:polysaccharide deacetylase family protein [Yinghuangia seranimata]|uniref:polysaccharide deacetylase family protein n=1 Tax=Yinghuangia seranimata TaxID=408067 RepID=UPI00248CA040|nr:polysaccharide deacetylase family protein [Yinghuangia seranimata]MDI2124561.1 polysaccharide deacetylase family protein [Yinghuangia seranimata]
MTVSVRSAGKPAAQVRLSGWHARVDAWRAPDVVLRRSPAQAWFRRRAAGRLAVLGYHGVEDADAFAAQLDMLCRVAHPVSLAEVEKAVHGGRPLPPHSVLVTFDDGDATVFADGLPRLAARGIPAVCFVVPSLLDTDAQFWWEEAVSLWDHGGTSRHLPFGRGANAQSAVAALKLLPDDERRLALAELRSTATRPAPPYRQLTSDEVRALDAGGVVVGNHTLSHPCLDRCTDARVEEEVTGAHERLTEVLGHAPTTFAYPNGNVDERADRVLDKLGYRTGFLYNHALADPRSCPPLRIDRLRVSTTIGPDRLATVLSGLHPAVFRTARGAARGAARVLQPLARTS